MFLICLDLSNPLASNLAGELIAQLVINENAKSELFLHALSTGELSPNTNGLPNSRLLNFNGKLQSDGLNKFPSTSTGIQLLSPGLAYFEFILNALPGSLTIPFSKSSHSSKF